MKVKRGPKPSLSATQIARAAIAVADIEGLAAVSIARVAREVGVTTMALYRYFSSKQELIDLMIDHAGGRPPGAGYGSKGWRVRLEEWARSCSSIYHDHPWFLQVTAARRIMGPNELKWLDAALAILAKTGLLPRQQHDAFLVLIGQIRSNAEFMSAQGASSEQWASITARLLPKRHSQYPALMAVIDSGAFARSGKDGRNFGLALILDGIEAQLAQSKANSKTG